MHSPAHCCIPNAGLEEGAVASLREKLLALFAGDTSSMSAMHCLQLYLQRLGYTVEATEGRSSGNMTHQDEVGWAYWG